MSKKFEQIGRISAAVLALPENNLGIALDAMNKLTDPAWKARLTEVFREGLKPVAQAAVEVVDKLLESLGKVVIDIDLMQSKGEIDKFFTTRDGLYVEDAFNQLFGEAAALEVPAHMELSKFRLRKNMKDSAIRKELPENHVFRAWEFRLMLAFQLAKQWGGKEGVFRTDGWAEIFYVKTDDGRVFTVIVNWYSDPDYREWSVSAWDLDDYEWHAVNSVYSRN